MSDSSKYKSLEELGSSIEQYNALRGPEIEGKLKTLCYAPFTGLMFDPRGEMGCCTCSFARFGNVKDGRTLKEVWNSPAFREMRDNMMQFKIDPKACERCALDIETTTGWKPYSVSGFDELAVDTAEPEAPTSLHFNLATTCNLKCIMCWEEVSSRIMVEREGRPVAPSPYGDEFFEQLREILPHVKKVSFTGGEPFMIKDHLRILEMMREIGSKARIYVSTNGLVLPPRVKELIADLDFQGISVSMDGYSKAVHEHVRVGMKHEKFMENLQWLFDARARHGFYVVLNFNELRQNWFEIPMIFRFAILNLCPVHTNHCVGPEFCTIYDLPRAQLQYVYDFLVEQKEAIGDGLQVRNNHLPYEHLLHNIEAKLKSDKDPELPPHIAEYMKSRDGGAPPANDDWSIYLNEKVGTDGLLAAPIPGQPPFETPEKVQREMDRIRALGGEVAERLLRDMKQQMEALGEAWVA